MDKNNKTNFHYQKALELFKKNNVTEAVKELKLCLKFNPKDISALNLLALGYYLKCRFDKAEKHWRQSLAIKRKDNQAADYLELITKKDFKELRQEYKEIIFNDTAAKSEKIDFLKNIIKEYDELIEPYLILGLLYKEEAKEEEALKYLYQAYDLDSGNKNIKDYIMECEKKEKSAKLFSSDIFDFSRFNLDDFILFKYKKETAAVLTALLAVFLIFYINSEQKPLNVENELNNNSVQKASSSQKNESSSQNEEGKDTETKAEETETNAGKEAENLAENDNPAAESETKKLNLDLMELQSFENPISLDLIRSVRKKEAEKKQDARYQEYFNEDREQQLFNQGLQAFRNQRYQDAAAIFAQIYKFSDADYLKRESLYLLARSSHLDQDYQEAEKNYRLYIENYPETNYYEEALYNLGLFLDEQGKTEAAKEVLQKLRDERPDSSYNNSHVYEILNK